MPAVARETTPVAEVFRRPLLRLEMVRLVVLAVPSLVTRNNVVEELFVISNERVFAEASAPQTASLE